MSLKGDFELSMTFTAPVDNKLEERILQMFREKMPDIEVRAIYLAIIKETCACPRINDTIYHVVGCVIGAREAVESFRRKQGL